MLGDARDGDVLGDVIHPPMPKGVEHLLEAAWANGWDGRVIHPPMPKGVEHIRGEAMRSELKEVIHPPMPKGVEHIRTRFVAGWRPMIT